MMTRVREVITSIIIAAAWYSFALFNYIYLIVLSLYQSGDFGWPTEQDRNKLLLGGCLGELTQLRHEAQGFISGH